MLMSTRLYASIFTPFSYVPLHDIANHRIYVNHAAYHQASQIDPLCAVFPQAIAHAHHQWIASPIPYDPLA